MANKPLDRVEMKDFPGLVLNLDPNDLQPGSAREQTNVTSARPAALEIRPGYRFVQFEDQT